VAIESRGPQAAIGMKVEGGLQFSMRPRSCPASRRSNRRARNGGASSSRGGHCDLSGFGAALAPPRCRHGCCL